MSKDLLPDGLISAECKGESTLWSRQPPSSLKDLATEGLKTLEAPERGTLLSGPALWRLPLHLQLPVQVVSEDRRQQIGLVSPQRPHGDVVHLTLRLQLPKDSFLGSPSVMERHDLASDERLVGDHDLEVVAVSIGLEEVELYWTSALDLHPAPDGQEAKSPRPGFGLPTQLEVPVIGVEPPPTASRFQAPFQLGETPERHGDSELDPGIVQQPDDLVAEEGAVHANLDHDPRQGSADPLQTLEDELTSSVAVVDIAGSVKEVQDLACLGDGGKERIVATPPLLLRIEPDGGALGVACRAQSRAIEIQSNATRSQPCQALKDQFSEESPQTLNDLLVQVLQHATKRGDIRQPLQPQQSLYDRIIVIEAEISKMPETEQQVDDQAEHQAGVTVGGFDLQMPEALSQPGSQIESGKQRLEEDQARERGQFLVLESQSGQDLGFTANGFSAKLHRGDLLGFEGCVVTPIITHRGRLFYNSLEISDFLKNGPFGNLTGREVTKHAGFLRKSCGLNYLSAN